MKVFLEATLVSLTLSTHYVLKFMEKRSQFHCTGLLNFQNLMKWQKMAKAKTVQKITYIWYSLSKD